MKIQIEGLKKYDDVKHRRKGGTAIPCEDNISLLLFSLESP